MEIRQTFFDRVVSAVSPKAGMKRLAARASLSAATALTSPEGRIVGRGGYKGGHSDRRQTRSWFAKARSANADGLGDHDRVVGRSRDAWMNMPIGRAVVKRPTTFTVGTGLMAIPDLDAEALGITPEEALELQSTIAADFDRYMASTDPDAERRATGYDQQRVVFMGVLSGGDILSVRVMPENQHGRRHETAWKLYESDRVVSPANHEEGTRWDAEQAPLRRVAETATGNVVAGGVETDDYGAPVAFHVLKSTPDTLFDARTSRTPGDTVRIRAWGDKTPLPTAMLIMQVERPEQFRGVSILAPVLEPLQNVSILTEAELFAAILQGMIAIIAKGDGASPLPEPEYGEPGTDATVGRDSLLPSDFKMEAGSAIEIDGGDQEIDLKTPGRPNPAFDPFFTAIVKQIAAATEIPVEVLMLAFTQSYSASRGALEVFYLAVLSWRDWLASHWCAWVYLAWLYEQVAKGRYAMPGFLTDDRRRELWSNVRFRGDGKISLDPAREAKALEVQEAHAWSTGAEITAELNGGDYDANVRRRAGEHQRFVDAKLPIPNAKGGGSAPASEHAPDRENEE